MEYKPSVAPLLDLLHQEPSLRVRTQSVNISLLMQTWPQGHGIGNADASATDAMLLTVLQDAFSRLTSTYLFLPHPEHQLSWLCIQRYSELIT